MTPAEHYRRARELMDQAESSWARGSNDPTERGERLERLQLADVHTKLGQLADTIGFLSANRRRTRVVLTLPAGDEQALDALNDLLGSATMAAEALTGFDSQNMGRANGVAWEALRDRTVWESDDDMRRFAATDG